MIWSEKQRKMLPIRMTSMGDNNYSFTAADPCDRCGTDMKNDPNAGFRYEDVEKDQHFERRIVERLCGNCI